MVTQIVSDYTTLKTINGLLGLTKKVYYVDDSAADKFHVIVLEPETQIQFIFKTKTSGKPPTFATDFPTAQKVSDIII